MSAPISKQRLASFLFDSGVNLNMSIHLPHTWYALPTRHWVMAVFGPALQAQQGIDKVREYVKGANVCVHFMRHASVFAARCHLLTEGRPEDAALCFGDFAFPKTKDAGHALNCFVTREDETKPEDLSLCFFEPQRCALESLTQEQITSCEFAFI